MKHWLRQLAQHLPDSCRVWIKKRHFTHKIAQLQISEEADLTPLKRFVQDGSVVFDIGANTGAYTRFLTDWVGRNGAVHAFEPVPETFAVLSAVSANLGWSNVILQHFAVSNQSGSVTFALPKDTLGGMYTARIGQANLDEQNITVPTVSLDDYCRINNVQPSFIKIDVEGHELSVLYGAVELLKKQPYLLIEVTGDPDVNGNAQDVMAFLLQYGYRPYWWNGTELTLRKAGDQTVNYFFLPL